MRAAVDEAMGWLKAAQAEADRARGPWGILAWTEASRRADAHLRLVRQVLQERQRSLEMGPSDVAVRLELQRRQEANAAWESQRQAPLAKAPIFTVLQLAKAGHPQIQTALLDGGLAQGIRVLEDAQMSQRIAAAAEKAARLLEMERRQAERQAVEAVRMRRRPLRRDVSGGGKSTPDSSRAWALGAS